MKKIFFASILMVITLAVNAQNLYVGGSVGFTTTSTKSDKTKITTDNGFALIPEVGYTLTDRMDLGIAFGIETLNQKNHVLDLQEKGTAWTVAPYLRYALLEFGDFRVLGKASIFVGGQKLSTHVGSVSAVSSDVFSYGLSVVPMLTYDLSDRITLFTGLDFMSLNLYGTSDKISKSSATIFDIGVGTNEALNVGSLSIGFVYNF